MLSAKQKQILELVQQNPQITLAELAKAVGLKSVSTVHVHIRKLIKENFLERNGHALIATHRPVDEFTPIPCYGFAQCGDTDIFAEEHIVLHKGRAQWIPPTGLGKANYRHSSEILL